MGKGDVKYITGSLFSEYWIISSRSKCS